MSATGRKEVIFIASALEDLRAFPDDVKSAMGFAIYQAQCGGKHISAKPLRGFKGTGVVEVVDDYDRDTYRAVYTVRYDDAVYVLHAFKKKAHKGSATPSRDIELIRRRLIVAEQLHQERRSQRKDA